MSICIPFSNRPHQAARSSNGARKLASSLEQRRMSRHQRVSIVLSADLQRPLWTTKVESTVPSWSRGRPPRRSVGERRRLWGRGGRRGTGGWRCFSRGARGQLGDAGDRRSLNRRGPKLRSTDRRRGFCVGEGSRYFGTQVRGYRLAVDAVLLEGRSIHVRAESREVVLTSQAVDVYVEGLDLKLLLVRVDSLTSGELIHAVESVVDVPVDAPRRR